MTPRRSTRRRVSHEVRAQILGAIAAGLTVQDCAAQYQIPAGTIHSWLSRNGESKPMPDLQPNQAQEIGELLLESVREIQRATIATAKAIQAPGYLSRANPADVAALLGELHAQGIRILEAWTDRRGAKAKADPRDHADPGDGDPDVVVGEAAVADAPGGDPVEG